MSATMAWINELVPYDAADVAHFLASGRPQPFQARLERGHDRRWTCDLLVYDPAKERRMTWQFIPVDADEPLPLYLASLPAEWRSRVQGLRQQLAATIAGSPELQAQRILQAALPTDEAVPDLAPVIRERMIPGVAWNELYVHSAKRYRFAQPYCAGRQVLDFGGGAGYGSRILARGAGRVIYVDVDAIAVAYAEATYPHPQIRRAQIDYIRPGLGLPFAGESFDVVICFEVIEHVRGEQAAHFLGEVCRVLRPDGTLVVSTPNKLIYRDYPDPHHVALRTAGEFRDLCATFFEKVQTFGQLRGQGFPSVFAEFRIVPGARDEHEILLGVCTEARRAVRSEGSAAGGRPDRDV